MKNNIKKDVRNIFYENAISYWLATIFTGIITSFPILPFYNHIKASIVRLIICLIIFIIYWIAKRPFIKKKVKKRIKHNIFLKKNSNVIQENSKKEHEEYKKIYQYLKKMENNVLISISNHKSNGNVIRKTNVYNITRNSIMNKSINKFNIGSKLYLLFQRKDSYVLMLPIEKGILVFAGSNMSDLSLNNKTSFIKGGRSDRIRKHVHKILSHLKEEGIIKNRLFVRPYIFNNITPALTFISQTPAAQKSSGLTAISNSTHPSLNDVMKKLHSNLTKNKK